MELAIQNKFDSYPKDAKAVLLQVRSLILEIAQQQDLGAVEETLKWGEPSYLVKGGSAVRFDWKEKTPQYYYLFFNCKTKLVDTFRELYSDDLEFQGNRTIVLNLSEPLPTAILQHCIELSLKYKSIKGLPLLGA
ncbi:MAG: hypothetical protein COA78_25735 [Blastopirellula sp.]|nr:MAG: hypothetical protein COA78_25735 [Blastopirellula sp.]